MENHWKPRSGPVLNNTGASGFPAATSSFSTSFFSDIWLSGGLASVCNLAFLRPRCLPLLPLFELSVPHMLDLDQKGILYELEFACVCATFCACWSSFFLFLITHCDLNYAIVVIILYFVFFINQSIITALLLCSWCILSHLYLNYDRKVSGLYTTNCWTMPCGILNVYPRHILCIKHRNCFFKKNSIFLVRLALFLGAYFLFGSLFFETKLLLKR